MIAPTAHAKRSGVDRRALGAQAERVAAEFLTAQGAEILLRNYRRRLGELDLVALHRGALLIVEVRTRSSDAYGGAAASVDGHKRRRIVRAAQQLLQQRKDLARLPVRFDVAVVSELAAVPPSVEWIRGAFEA
ncbi:MAG TPA: YraN family protein [Steroidobacteraceae bacterium]|nr:YraN family protein [Steroidobacteraceae bacterium]